MALGGRAQEPILIDSDQVIGYVRRIHDRTIAPGTVWSWASRGKLTRYGRVPGARRTLYDLHQVAALTEQLYVGREQ